jgi:hypothetical protein
MARSSGFNEEGSLQKRERKETHAHCATPVKTPKLRKIRGKTVVVSRYEGSSVETIPFNTRCTATPPPE